MFLILPISRFVGVAGFEPATSASQTRRDNRATLHPEIVIYKTFCSSFLYTSFQNHSFGSRQYFDLQNQFPRNPALGRGYNSKVMSFQSICDIRSLTYIISWTFLAIKYKRTTNPIFGVVTPKAWRPPRPKRGAIITPCVTNRARPATQQAWYTLNNQL